MRSFGCSFALIRIALVKVRERFCALPSQLRKPAIDVDFSGRPHRVNRSHSVVATNLSARCKDPCQQEGNGYTLFTVLSRELRKWEIGSDWSYPIKFKKVFYLIGVRPVRPRFPFA